MNEQFWENIEWLTCIIPSGYIISSKKEPLIKYRILRSCDPASMLRYLSGTDCIYGLKYSQYLLVQDNLIILRGTAIEVYKNNRSVIISMRSRVPSDEIVTSIQEIRDHLEADLVVISRV